MTQPANDWSKVMLHGVSYVAVLLPLHKQGSHPWVMSNFSSSSDGVVCWTKGWWQEVGHLLINTSSTDATSFFPERIIAVVQQKWPTVKSCFLRWCMGMSRSIALMSSRKSWWAWCQGSGWCFWFPVLTWFFHQGLWWSHFPTAVSYRCTTGYLGPELLLTSVGLFCVVVYWRLRYLEKECAGFFPCCVQGFFLFQ